jgi:ABC-type multidrug transport system ATPase subunit
VCVPAASQSTFLNVLSSKATYGMMTGEVEVVEVTDSTDLDAVARRMSVKRVNTSPSEDPSPWYSQSQSSRSVGSGGASPARRRGGAKKPLGLQAIRLDMGYVPQDDTVHDELTVIENLRFR